MAHKQSLKTLGDRLRHLREKRGLTREQLAVAAGVGSKTIERLEYNQRMDANSETLIGFSDALDVSIDFLLRGRDFKPAVAQ